MKSFFEQYGFVILAAIVIIILIAMCTPIDNTVKTQISNITKVFANRANNKIEATYNERDLLPGTVIELEGDRYIVLEQKGKTRYLIWKQNIVHDLEGKYDIAFDKNQNNIYSGSTIDSFLENIYYKSLPSNLKGAIIQQEIEQDFDGDASSKEVGYRHVYLPSISEIRTAMTNASNATDSIASAFFYDEKGDAHYYWLRTSDSINNKAMYLRSETRNIDSSWCDWGFSIRPAFVADLSLMNYEIIEKIEN